MKDMVKVYLLLGLAFIIGACSSNSEKNKQDLDKITKENVLATLAKVNDKWQSEHDVIHQNAFWHNATYHIGNLAAYQLTKNQQYLAYTLEWAENNQWSGAKSTNPKEWKFTYGETDEYVLFGDWQACFQVYIDLYQLEPEEFKMVLTAQHSILSEQSEERKSNLHNALKVLFSQDPLSLIFAAAN